MSFGFSAGDFIAAATLIIDVVKSLRSAGGSQEEYQELVRELECLNRVLQHVDKLQARGCPPQYLAGAKCAALSCQFPLRQFKTKIEKYELRLGLRATATKRGPITATQKVEWEFKMKESVQSLRAIVTQWIGNINALLNIHGLEVLEKSSREAHEENRLTRIEVERCHKSVKSTGRDVATHTGRIEGAITKLIAVVQGDVVQPLDTLRALVTTACVNIQQITVVVHTIQTALSTIHTRYTYFQAPIKVEDALGYVFPFPSELSFDELQAIFKSRFRDKPGRKQVEAGDYEVSNANNSKQLIQSGTSAMRPGMSVVMAIIVAACEGEDKCPNPGCYSSNSVQASDGGRRCAVCDVWFEKSTRVSVISLGGEFVDVPAQGSKRTRSDDDCSDWEDDDSVPRKRSRGHDRSALRRPTDTLTLFRNLRVHSAQARAQLGPEPQKVADNSTGIHYDGNLLQEKDHEKNSLAQDRIINALLNNDEPSEPSPPIQAAPTPVAVPPVKKGPGRGNWRRNKGKTSAPSSMTLG